MYGGTGGNERISKKNTDNPNLKPFILTYEKTIFLTCLYGPDGLSRSAFSRSGAHYGPRPKPLYHRQWPADDYACGRTE
jgi:hypothetical protein